MPEKRRGQDRALFKPQRRDVGEKTRLFLFVHAGGRCEFDGCNRYLVEHHLTKADGVFAQMAHIWAFSDGGPRARKGSTNKHARSNLMLLCGACHKLVDENAKTYTAEVLRQHKKAHEDRVFLLTDTKPDRSTVAFALRGKVAGQPVSISKGEMEAAVAPRYLGRDFVECDLTALRDRADESFWREARDAVETAVKSLFERRFEGVRASHISVFAIAPIPLLVFLGTQLSNKVPTALYQRHRDREDWRWKEEGATAQFTTRRLRDGTDQSCVALLLSLSGRINEVDLPPEIDEKYTIFEMALKGQEPTPRFLERESSLHAFRDEYMRAIRQVVAEHPSAHQIALFPAVPAPIAVAIGRDLLPKRDPALVVFDFDKRAAGFTRALEVNQK